MSTSCTTDNRYFANNNFPIHLAYLITYHIYSHIDIYLNCYQNKHCMVSFVMIANSGTHYDCLVSVYLLHYKGCVYITILFVGTSKCVGNSREFAIIVFVLTLIKVCRQCRKTFLLLYYLFFVIYFFFSFPLTAFCDFSAIFHWISLIFGQLVDNNL